MSTSFPSSPDKVTAAWLSRVLAHHVENLEVEHFAEGAGIIGQVVRINLDSDAPFKSLVGKFPSPSEGNRLVAKTYNMYGREVDFYQRIAPKLDLRTPKCYFGEFDESSNNFVLLIEDLKDYEIGDQVEGCSLDQAHMVISNIAKLHALAWQPGAGFGLVSHNNPAQRDGMIAGFHMGWPVVMDGFRDLVPSAALIAERKMEQATPWLLEEITRPPICLTHADVRLDNVFFGEQEVCLVDWQSVCTSCPEQDLAYFLTQSVALEMAESADLKGLYFDELRARGIDYPRKLFEERYKIAALYLLNYAVIIAGTLDLGNERGQALGRTLLGGSFAALDALGAFELLS